MVNDNSKMNSSDESTGSRLESMFDEDVISKKMESIRDRKEQSTKQDGERNRRLYQQRQREIDSAIARSKKSRPNTSPYKDVDHNPPFMDSYADLGIDYEHEGPPL